LKGQSNGTVVLRFAIRPNEEEICFAVDSFSAPDKLEAIALEEVSFHGNLSNYIQRVEKIKFLMPLIGTSNTPILQAELCDLRPKDLATHITPPGPYSLLHARPSIKQNPNTPPQLTNNFQGTTIPPPKKLKKDLPPPDVKVEDWTTEKVQEWLKKSEDWEKLGLPLVPQKFFDEDVSGSALLSLAERDLEFLGISKLGPKRRIMERITILKRGP